MKMLHGLLITLAAAVWLSPALVAGDLEDVIASRRAHFAALNDGDVEAWVGQHLPGHSEFRADLGLLVEPPSFDAEIRSLGARIKAGLKTNYHLENVQAKLYGNVAVTTCYIVGTITEPDGTVRQVHDRLSSVLVKTKGQWKEVHIHRSPLTLPEGGRSED